MSDPGWDIPGVDRAGSDGPGGDGAACVAGGTNASRPAAAGGKRSRKARRLASVSALGGPSAGAFARPGSTGSHAGAPGSAGPGSAGPGPAAPEIGSSDSSSHGSGSGSSSPVPADAGQALAWLSGGLDFLAHADASEWPAGLQADCLRALAVAESRQAAVHARVLAAFCVPGGGLAGDGHRSARVWLSWQTQSTARSAAVKVGWKNRLAGHPVLAAALAAGTISVSWAQ
ncbi:MAG TPA: hypothetical protein VMR00_18495, partial [Streptosporangiaceae bacterium]|nr:hypothetical protein [Streptosporangiaceae bacterium]